MKKKILNLVNWLRAHGKTLSWGEQFLVIIAVVLATVRIILPVWHDFDGTLFYSYPFSGGEVCIRVPGRCSIDRSRTAIESGALLILATGIIMIKRTVR